MGVVGICGGWNKILLYPLFRLLLLYHPIFRNTIITRASNGRWRIRLGVGASCGIEEETYVFAVSGALLKRHSVKNKDCVGTIESITALIVGVQPSENANYLLPRISASFSIPAHFMANQCSKWMSCPAPFPRYSPRSHGAASFSAPILSIIRESIRLIDSSWMFGRMDRTQACRLFRIQSGLKIIIITNWAFTLITR